MSPFDILGLPRDAPVADIKRAYARALRAHRPDVDPEGFARVTEAFHQCLASAAEPRSRIAVMGSAGASGRSEPTPVAVGAARDGAAPAPPDVAPPDFAPLVEALAARARTDSPAQLDAWLHGLDIFFPIAARALAADDVVDALSALEPPPSPAQLDAILGFFDLASVRPVQWWLDEALTRLRWRSRQFEDFRRIEQHYRSAKATWMDRQLANEAFGPPSLARRLLIVLVPGLPTRAAAVHAQLLEEGGEYAAAKLDPAAGERWSAVADRTRLDGRRVALMMGRIALLCFAILPLILGTGELRTCAWIAAGLAGLWALAAIPAALRTRLVAWLETSSWAPPDPFVPVFAVLGIAVSFLSRWYAVLPFLAGCMLFAWATRGALGRAQDEDALRWQALAAIGATLALVLVAGGTFAPEGWLGGVELPMLAYGLGVLGVDAHDRLRSRRLDRPKGEMRTGAGWLGAWAAAQFVAAIVLGVSASVF